MSREDFVVIAIRLFSIYLLLNLLRFIPAAFQLATQDQGMILLAISVFVLILALLVCLLLWFFPLTVARKLLPVLREPRSEQAMDSSAALSVGLTLIGVWVMSYSLGDAGYWLTLLVRTQQIDAAQFEWSHEHFAGMVSTFVQLTIAVWLVFGSVGIRRLIYRFRYGASSDAC